MKKLSSILVYLIAFFLFVNSSSAQNKQITLSDIWQNYSFYANSFRDVKSMKDGEHYSTLYDGVSIDEYAYKTGEKTRSILQSSDLVVQGKTEPITIDDYKFCDDESKVLISANSEPLYRHSSISDFYVYDLKNKRTTYISDGGKQRLASLSPDGSKVAFVRSNNLFVRDLSTNVETPITTDGKINSIINGTTDWVYEEEFGFTEAFFWSPDGKNIAYYRFDESKVKEFSLTMYYSLYPEQYDYKYPKAGEDNSLVSIHVYNVKSATTKTMDIGKEPDQYIPRIKWTQDPKILSIQRMNRLQNKLEILFADPASGTTKVIYNEENKYYIDITDNLTFTKDKKYFIISSEQDAYNHLYLYDINGKLVNQITKGKWDVDKFVGYDEANKLVYYTTAAATPMNRDLYSIKMDGTKNTNITNKVGTNDPMFSSNYKYYINTFSDINTPYYITLNTANGKQIKVLEENTKLLNRLKTYQISKVNFFTFKTSEAIELNGWMVKPPDFDETKKYPVLLYVYGGPGSQTVKNEWERYDYAWYQMLAQKGYIIVSVDNRGTGARGEAFKKMTYLQLGKYETIDQIETAKYFGSLPYVDKARIGIWGWSFGGYLSTSCITKGADYFKMAVAVAPVTNWRYYDNIYTERFMRTPNENTKGYDDNSPIHFVNKLKGKYLLIHGTADDNVHTQNSMMLIKELIDADKQFEMQFYPDKNHSIYGGNTRYHLYTRITDFILKNL